MTNHNNTGIIPVRYFVGTENHYRHDNKGWFYKILSPNANQLNGWWECPTSPDKMPFPRFFPDFATACQVDRLPLVLPDGWTEVTNGWEQEASQGYFCRTFISNEPPRYRQISFSAWESDAGGWYLDWEIINPSGILPKALEQEAAIIRTIQAAFDEGDKPPC